MMGEETSFVIITLPLLESITEKVLHGYGWEDVGSFGNAAYMTTSYPVDKDTMTTITDSIKDLADILLDRSKKDGYGISLALEIPWLHFAYDVGVSA
ncbi:MAG TPA: hypothetical protein VHP81_13795 [Lachnospiraceae bacterium]|nr:hypothetical protein [Lachnospiraceae bacterium]